MAWKRLTIDDMKLYLAKDELDKLQTCSIDEDFTDVVNTTLDVVADAFRGAWTGKGYNVYARDHYIDTAYTPFILAYSRWVLWNRFPAAGDYALTDTRKEEFTAAQELLKNPYIGLSKPDYSSDPELSGSVISQTDPAITVPWLKFAPQWMDTGFPQAYYCK